MANPGGEARSWRSKISRLGTSSGTFTGPNPRRPEHSLFRQRYFPDAPQLRPLLRGIKLASISCSCPSQFDAVVASSRCVVPRCPCGVPRRRGCSGGSHGCRGRTRTRTRQCLRRRRRVGVLLLCPARHPQERLRHRHTRRLPAARPEVAPGPVGQRPRRGRRGQAAVPADPGGVLRLVRQGEEGHVRRRAVRPPRRRRPGFLRLHAGDAGDDGQREKREAGYAGRPAEDAGGHRERRRRGPWRRRARAV